MSRPKRGNLRTLVRNLVKQAEQTPGLDLMKKLIEMMRDVSGWQIEGIVNEAEVKGPCQECEWFGHQYVDQRCGHGDDDYYGHLYVPLEGRYLKISYRC